MTKYEVIQGVYYLYDKWRGGLYTPGLTYIGMNPPALVAIFVIALFCLLLKEIPEHI